MKAEIKVYWGPGGFTKEVIKFLNSLPNGNAKRSKRDARRYVKAKVKCKS